MNKKGSWYNPLSWVVKKANIPKEKAGIDRKHIIEELEADFELHESKIERSFKGFCEAGFQHFDSNFSGTHRVSKWSLLKKEHPEMKNKLMQAEKAMLSSSLKNLNPPKIQYEIPEEIRPLCLHFSAGLKLHEDIVHTSDNRDMHMRSDFDMVTRGSKTERVERRLKEKRHSGFEMYIVPAFNRNNGVRMFFVIGWMKGKESSPIIGSSSPHLNMVGWDDLARDFKDKVRSELLR